MEDKCNGHTGQELLNILQFGWGLAQASCQQAPYCWNSSPLSASCRNDSRTSWTLFWMYITVFNISSTKTKVERWSTLWHDTRSWVYVLWENSCSPRSMLDTEMTCSYHSTLLSTIWSFKWQLWHHRKHAWWCHSLIRRLARGTNAFSPATSKWFPIIHVDTLGWQHLLQNMLWMPCRQAGDALTMLWF